MKFKAEYVIPIVILVLASVFSLFDVFGMFIINENYSNKNAPLAYSEYKSGSTASSGQLAGSSEQKMAPVDQTMAAVDQKMATVGLDRQTNAPVDQKMATVDQTMAPVGSIAYTSAPYYASEETPGPDYASEETPGPDYAPEQTFAPNFYQSTMYNNVETAAAQEGFANLDSVSAKYGTESTLDIYSQAEGDKTCEPGPYSNSKGYLCLDKNQKHLLMTRGMNQSGSSHF